MANVIHSLFLCDSRIFFFVANIKKGVAPIWAHSAQVKDSDSLHLTRNSCTIFIHKLFSNRQGRVGRERERDIEERCVCVDAGPRLGAPRARDFTWHRSQTMWTISLSSPPSALYRSIRYVPQLHPDGIVIHVVLASSSDIRLISGVYFSFRNFFQFH